MPKHSAPASASLQLLAILRLAGALILVGVLGFLIGIATMKTAAPPNAAAAFTLRPDTRPTVPTVTLERLRDGQLIGSQTESVRLFVGDTPVPTTLSGQFAVPAGPLLTHEITVTVPAWARYVASKRGQKYYAVTAGSAQRIAPENRVYFADEQTAEAAGYRR